MKRFSILKLTPQSQYGIGRRGDDEALFNFEVDSTESVWYKDLTVLAPHVLILKLTPQSQYGIS